MLSLHYMSLLFSTLYIHDIMIVPYFLKYCMQMRKPRLRALASVAKRLKRGLSHRRVVVLIPG